jgi:hypothetical protein
MSGSYAFHARPKSISFLIVLRGLASARGQVPSAAWSCRGSDGLVGGCDWADFSSPPRDTENPPILLCFQEYAASMRRERDQQILW